MTNIIEVSFGGGSIAYVKVDTAYFYNHGILFKPVDLDLPTSYQVHWADSPQATSTLETIGTSEGAPIPDDLWNRSRVIYGWIYLHPTQDSGVTYKEVRIYKNVRAGLPDGTEPTPAEQSTIDQLISAMNSAVEQTGEDAESASQSAQSAESAKTAAESARDTAQGYANNASASATSAQTSASQASASATASAQSASQSAQIKSDIEDMVDDAQGYADSASQSASQASASEQGCARAVLDATSAAAIARARAEEASGYAQTASTKASEASASASTASQKATEASQSASQALSYKTDAESAKTASQTAQGLAESARDTAVSAKTDAESARDDAESARDEAVSAVASISGALAEKAPVITDTASGSIASFSDGADNMPLKSLVVDIDPIQDLHGQDSPYPAGGGANKFDGIMVADGSYLLSANYITVTGGQTWYIYAPNFPANDFCYAKLYDSNFSEIDAGTAHRIGQNTTYTIPSGVAYIKLRYWRTFDATNMAFNYPATVTTYSPYSNLCPISGWTQVNVNHSDADMTNPTTITIDLGQTVYGGELDVLRGVLTVDRAMVDLGTLTWSYYSSETYPRFFTQSLNGIVKPTNSNDGIANVECSEFSISSANNQYLGHGEYSIAVNRTGIVFVRDPNYTDITSFTAGMSGVQFVYPLAEPIEIQLTPNQINSLYGVNNLWADSGDTEVEYRANTKLYIAKKIAEALASLT